MLQSIRENTKGWIAGIIIALLIVPFALWGIGNYFTAQVGTWVAKVNGEEISQAEFRTAYNNFREQRRAQLGEAFDPEQFESAVSKRDFLEQFIRQEAMRQVIDEIGFTVSPQMLAQTIASYPVFQVNGQFSAQRYQQILEQERLTPRAFEQQVREGLLGQALALGLSTSALATDDEIQKLLRLTGQTRTFDYFLIDAASFAEQVEISDRQMQAYYQSHPDEFMTAETVTIEYLELAAEDLDSEITVDEAALRAYFDDNRSSYLTEEQRLTSHILIQVPEGADPEAEEAARQRAQSLAEQIRDGADFAQLANTESDDVGSADEGGNLGWIEEGQMASAFSDALYDLEVGEVSDPVRTSFGFHIIKLRDIQESTGQNFTEARAQVAQDFKASEAERLYLERADRLVNLTYRNPSSLIPAAEALNLEIQTAGPFTREGGEGAIALNEAVIEAAFSDLVLAENTNSDLIELGANHMLILRAAEHNEPELKPLDAVDAEIRAQLISQKASELARRHAQALVERLKTDAADLEALTAEQQQELISADQVNRGAQGHPQALLAEVFQLPAPEGEVGYHSLSAGEDRFAVVALRDIAAGDADAAPDFQQQVMRQQLEQVYLRAELQAMLDSLAVRAEVEIAEDRL